MYRDHRLMVPSHGHILACFKLTVKCRTVLSLNTLFHDILDSVNVLENFFSLETILSKFFLSNSLFVERTLCRYKISLNEY